MRTLLQASGVALAAISLALAGCKPKSPDTIAVKSLDNFAAGYAIRQNACTADPTLKGKPGWTNPLAAANAGRIVIDSSLPPDRANALRQEVVTSLSAIPDSMQALFAAFGGYINIANDTNAICTAKLNDPRQRGIGFDTVRACFTYERNGDKARFRINIAPNATEIRHGLVRVFGYLFAQFFARIGPPTGTQFLAAIGARESNQFANIKIKMAQSFLADLAASKVFDLKKMETYLGAGAADVVRTRLENLKKAGDLANGIAQNFPAPRVLPQNGNLDLLGAASWLYPGESANLTAEQRETRRRRFEDYVFAEAFDSFYCNPAGSYVDTAAVQNAKSGALTATERDALLRETSNTKYVMRDFFPMTYQMFSGVEQSLLQLATHMTTPSAGLALTSGSGDMLGTTVAITPDASGVTDPTSGVTNPGIPVNPPGANPAIVASRNLYGQSGLGELGGAPDFRRFIDEIATRINGMNGSDMWSRAMCDGQLGGGMTGAGACALEGG